MPHRYRYRCPLCGTDSRPYLTRPGADAHARRHRDEHHDGDHPIGERVRETPWRPTHDERTAIAVAVAVIVVVAIVRALGN
ncbi:hypothetical protein OG292_03160 [Streptomyces sp. NBC_01511]|uniref:hypothetical protein n=1 Tax=Streptomyces sp. NBC_01511 TaxID=2903889 RepID=UPI00386A2642